MSRTTHTPRNRVRTGQVGTLFQRWLASNRAYGNAWANWAHPGTRTTPR